MDSEHADLDIDASVPAEADHGTALARARALALALSDAARRARLSTRRRRRLSSGGFENRQGAKTARILLFGSFLMVVVLPTLAAIAYFEFIAANQYVAQAQFTVSAGESPLRDGVDSLTGVPLQLIQQDVQIITNFIHSREIVDRLEAQIGLRKRYSGENADSWARFKADAPIERLVKYWTNMSSASIKLPGGLVSLSIRAFTPQDAKLVADTTVGLCEQLVNSLNERINRDAVALAEESMNRATERLSKALAAEEVARNASGILETNMSAQSITSMVRQLELSQLSLSASYETQIKYMNAETPQMQDLKLRINVMKGQIAKLQGQLTTAPGTETSVASTDGNSTIASAMATLGELEVERKAAEQLYANSAAALEHARIAAEYKMIYLKVFVSPSLPQESEYPRRHLNLFLVAVSSIALWGFLVALAAVARNNMA